MERSESSSPEAIRLFLCGDVMTGRGIDQILRHPNDPILYETWAKSAHRYVELAEQRNGPIPRHVAPEYIWGDALGVLDDARVDARIINLETAVTNHDEPWPGKGIHYRMHPENVDSITAAGIHCCVLANNHILDWSYPGLAQTLHTIDRVRMASAGAGIDHQSAAEPAVIMTRSGRRVVVIAVGSTSSGIPPSWQARPDQPGLLLTHTHAEQHVNRIAETVSAVARAGDVVIVSIHWGPNWGYDIPTSHQRFAHRLVDEAGVHVVHGHSSHHPMGIEVYRNRLVLYGCGDLVNDYEGIGGHEEFHPDLGIIYLATLDPSDGTLQDLEMVPMMMRRFRLEHAPTREVAWLQDVLARESLQLGVVVEREDGRFEARW